ncbi:hypothetical protein ACHAPT_010315 [Fusarium lateritium]
MKSPNKHNEKDTGSVNDLEALPTTDNAHSDEMSSTHRGLKSRHIQLIAIGGTIGTGLFVGSGSILTRTGPAPMLIAYIWMSAMVWFVMLDLGEMASYMPIKGLTVPYMVKRFLDPSLGFSAGWMYWMAFGINVAAEAVACGIIMEYWVKDIHPAVWITLVIIVCLLLNVVAVALFGEAEFWFASIKVIAILGLLILGVVLFFGGGPSGEALYFRYWKDPGAFNPYLVDGSTGRFLAVWYAMIRAAYSYILCPELIPMTAGESVAPRRNVPKATNRYIYRMVFFYVGGALVIGIIVPFNDPRLMNAVNSGVSDAGASPFVVAIQAAGIPALNHILNGVILTSAWSAGNSCFFAASRMLYGMANTGDAPRFFAKCNRMGVPYYAIAATFSLSLLAYITVSNSGVTVFTWLTSIIVNNGFICWRFRKATVYHDIRNQLPFTSPLQPYGTYFALVIFILLVLTNGFSVFFPGNFNVTDFLTAYLSILVFVILYFGHKAYFRTAWYKPIEDIDLFSGLEEVEAVTAADVDPKPKNLLQKLWFYIA